MGFTVHVGPLSGDCDRDLDFAALLAVLHQLVGEQVSVEVGTHGGPIILDVRGVLRHLADLQLTFGSCDGPAHIAFTIDGLSSVITVRERDILGARAYTVPGVGLGRGLRHVQVVFRGGSELVIGEDRPTDRRTPTAQD